MVPTGLAFAYSSMKPPRCHSSRTPTLVNEVAPGRRTNQFPPPTSPPLNPLIPLPKTNMYSSPFCRTVKYCFQSLFLALLALDSMYCLCDSRPSLAQGAPRRASSSSDSSSTVLTEMTEAEERSSSSFSLMTACERFEANPIDAKGTRV